MITPALKLYRDSVGFKQVQYGMVSFFYHTFKYSQALSVLRRPISLEYKELLCAAEHMLRHIAPQSIPYWLAGATTAPPGNDLEVRQPPTLTLEGPHRPRGYDLRGCEHCRKGSRAVLYLFWLTDGYPRDAYR
jgi:hypothetical protein